MRTSLSDLFDGGSDDEVAEVMTRDAISIRATDTIRQAAMMMADLKVGSLPVCDGEELVGTVTDRDIAVRAVASGVDPVAPVIDIATQPVQWCYEDDDLADVKRKMEGRRIRRVPVLDHQKRCRPDAGGSILRGAI
ncbi:CBS domain-containing protein [Paraburkholderia sp. J63]|uniref:CBS domain-containing protein n=1 Tax=Paraburkholderia sp. J63 TaxID=2805434 RepID=UPI002ABE491F|nr:CBS domain-containing protein [Paraburkholderia sp. J63]